MTELDTEALDSYGNYIYNLGRANGTIWNKLPDDAEPALDRQTAYLLCFCHLLLGELDSKVLFLLAYKFCACNASNQREYRRYTSRFKKLFADADVQTMVHQTDENLLKAMSRRLLEQHGNSILNLCPRCGALARTPQSRQCPECIYRWDDSLPAEMSS